MNPTLKQSLAACLAGQVNSGKTYQAQLCFNAHFILPDGSVFHPFGRALYVAFSGDKQSAAGTADELVTSPNCVFYKPATVEEAIANFDRILAAGVNGQPFDMAVLDSYSSLKAQAAAEIRNRAASSTGDAGGTSLSGQASKRTANNYRDIHRYAAPAVASMIQAYNGAGSDRPRLLLSMIHTKELWQGSNDNRRCVGQEPVASEESWRQIHGAQSIIWHMERQLGEAPVKPGMSIDQMNAVIQDDTFVAYTRAKNWAMAVGKLPHVKSQSGASMEAFSQVPACWESPNLGSIMLDFLCNQHGIIVGEHDDPSATAHWVDSLSIQLH